MLPLLGLLTARNHLRFHVPGEAFKRHAKEWERRIVADAAPAERTWLIHLRDALGPRFALRATDDFWLLSPLDSKLVAATADVILRARGQVKRALGRLAAPMDEPIVVVVFDDEIRFGQYISGNSELAGTMVQGESCVFIDTEHPHFAALRADLTLIEPVVADRFARQSLSHLSLPAWLVEGIAAHVTHQIAGAPRHGTIPMEMHHAFWDEEEIQAFWSGEVFRSTDDVAALSRDLAQLLVENLAQQWSSFERFVLEASPDDAGAKAAKNCIGIDQGAYACALLGLEPSMAWSPRKFSVV